MEMGMHDGKTAGKPRYSEDNISQAVVAGMGTHSVVIPREWCRAPTVLPREWYLSLLPDFQVQLRFSQWV